MTVSSQVKVTTKDNVLPNPSVLQEIAKDQVAGNERGMQETPGEAQKLFDKELRERVYALEERVKLLAKFTIKVTHAATITLHPLKENQEGDLTNEDSIMLFDFLAKDWANILLKGKDEKKSN